MMADRKRQACRICGRTFGYPSVHDHSAFPFCSPRCRDIDLGRWFTGQYVISDSLMPDDAVPPPDDSEPYNP